MKIAMIGCGNMGSALAKRLSLENTVFLYDHHIEKQAALAKFGKLCRTYFEALQNAEAVILAVKPQSLKKTAKELQESLKKDQIIISLLAGVTLQSLKECFPKSAIVRIMPNLAVQYGEGVIGASCRGLKQDIKMRLAKLLNSLGKVYWIPEKKMDALTSLTGSGPAFFYAIMEAIVEAGITMGFTPQVALDMTLHMAIGSLTLLSQSEKPIKELIREIASPGGTTMAGLKKLEESPIQEIIKNTFQAACQRATELASIEINDRTMKR